MDSDSGAAHAALVSAGRVNPATYNPLDHFKLDLGNVFAALIAQKSRWGGG